MQREQELSLREILTLESEVLMKALIHANPKFEIGSFL
jgi:hypothetical protein